MTTTNTCKVKNSKRAQLIATRKQTEFYVLVSILKNIIAVATTKSKAKLVECSHQVTPSPRLCSMTQFLDHIKKSEH